MSEIDIEKKIKKYLFDTGITRKDFCNSIKLSNAGLSNIYSRNDIDTKWLREIEKVYNVPRGRKSLQGRN